MRELEGAIGCNSHGSGYLDSPVFRHTGIHRRIRRDYFERRDAIMVLQASLLSTASIASHPGFSLKAVIDATLDARNSLVRIVFPYAKIEQTKEEDDNYDKYFDELDEYLKSKGGNSESSDVEGTS